MGGGGAMYVPSDNIDEVAHPLWQAETRFALRVATDPTTTQGNALPSTTWVTAAPATDTHDILRRGDIAEVLGDDNILHCGRIIGVIGGKYEVILDDDTVVLQTRDRLRPECKVHTQPTQKYLKGRVVFNSSSVGSQGLF